MCCFLKLVLDLIQNYWLSKLASTLGSRSWTYSSFRYLIICQYSSHICDPWKPCLIIRLVACSQISQTSVRTPKCKTTSIRLSIAVWSGSSYHPESGFFRVVEYALNVLPGCFEVVHAFGGRMVGPEEIYTTDVRHIQGLGRERIPDSIEPIGTKLLENFLVLVSTLR